MSDVNPPLKRTLSLPLITFFGLGNILGAGIYVLVGKVAGPAGIYAPYAFVLASLIASFTAFTYAELSARYPVSAGEAVYLYKGFHWRWLSIVVGMLLVLAGIVSAAAISHGFVGYVQVFFAIPDAVLLVGLILVLGLVAFWGVGESVIVAAIFTVIEIIGLLLVVWVGRDSFGDIHRLIEPASAGDAWISVGLISGAFLAFYAYIGFEDMVNVAEEVKQPQKNLPRAIIISLLVSSALYFLVASVAVLSIEPQQLALSDAPLALVYAHHSNSKPVIITLISLFAVVNGALIQIIMGSRILYGMSCNGWLPAWFKQVHSKRQTPMVATGVVVGLLLLFALALKLVALAEMTSYLILTVFVLINLALLKIKRQEPYPENVKTWPVWIPVCGLVTSLALLVFKVLSVVLGGS